MYTKSKQILIIKPRHCLEIVVYKQISEDEYLEVAQCVTIANFSNEAVQEMKKDIPESVLL